MKNIQSFEEFVNESDKLSEKKDDGYVPGTLIIPSNGSLFRPYDTKGKAYNIKIELADYEKEKDPNNPIYVNIMTDKGTKMSVPKRYVSINGKK